MALTTENQVFKGAARSGSGGTQILYKFGSLHGFLSWGLSCVDTFYDLPASVAWEIAVVILNANNDIMELRYDTPLTSDVERFNTDEEANAFIAKAEAYFASRKPE